MDRDYAKQKARSRDCSCINGKDRDNNFNEVIDEVFDYFERSEKTRIIPNVPLNERCKISEGVNEVKPYRIMEVIENDTNTYYPQKYVKNFFGRGKYKNITNKSNKILIFYNLFKAKEYIRKISNQKENKIYKYHYI